MPRTTKISAKSEKIRFYENVWDFIFLLRRFEFFFSLFAKILIVLGNYFNNLKLVLTVSKHELPNIFIKPDFVEYEQFALKTTQYMLTEPMKLKPKPFHRKKVLIKNQIIQSQTKLHPCFTK